MKFLYNLLVGTVLMFALPARLLYLGRSSKYHHSEWERLGLNLDKINIREGSLWIHASSVGEINAVTPLINIRMSGASEIPVFITTMTPTGHALAKKKFGASAAVSYVPVDLPGIVEKTWNAAKPRALVLVETEIWPNLLNQARISGTPVVIVNGRLRESSVRRFRRWKGLFGPALDALSIVCVQSEAEKSKFLEAGVREERITVTGNMKYDVDLPDINRPFYRDRFGISPGTRVIVAGSTHGGEEKLVLEAFRACCEIDKNTVLVIAPRHKGRFSEVDKLLEGKGYYYKKRTDLEEKLHDPLTGGQILLLDTLGELAEVYGSAEMVIIGGSFARIGGHNPVEPARWGVPIIIGPHHDTITVDAGFLSETGGLAVVDETGLVEQCRKWWGKYDELEAAGLKLREKLGENKGAAQKNLVIIQKIMGENG